VWPILHVRCNPESSEVVCANRRSDLQCCQHHEAYGYYDHQDTVDINGWMRDEVGGCDWNFMWLRQYNTGANSDNTCGFVEVVRDRVWKVGTATAEW